MTTGSTSRLHRKCKMTARRKRSVSGDGWRVNRDTEKTRLKTRLKTPPRPRPRPAPKEAGRGTPRETVARPAELALRAHPAAPPGRPGAANAMSRHARPVIHLGAALPATR